jgi:hypothetical protein
VTVRLAGPPPTRAHACTHARTALSLAPLPDYAGLETCTYSLFQLPQEMEFKRCNYSRHRPQLVYRVEYACVQGATRAIQLAWRIQQATEARRRHTGFPATLELNVGEALLDEV